VSLDRILDPLAARLSAAISGLRVDDVGPAVAADLPCAVLSLDEAEQAVVGIGRVPRGTSTGALLLSASVDLAHPVLDLGSGELLQLLSPDRRTLTLPHGPVVRADGTSDTPFGGADVRVEDHVGLFSVVPGAPAGPREVQVDPAAGTLVFGAPLPATGTLRVEYRIGRWETVTTRVQGLLTVRVVAVTLASVAAAAREVATALAAADPGVRAVPRSWGPVLPVELGTATVRSQALGFRLDAELEEPVLTSGGGVVARVAVSGDLDGGLVEPFDVTRGVTT
jgi:hypothetical protein